MKKRNLLLSLLAMLCLLPAVLVMASDNEQDQDDQGTEVQVSMDQLPAAVRAVYEKFAAAGEVDDIYMEVEDGNTAFSAAVEIGASEFELKVSPDGQILEVEYEEGQMGAAGDDEADENADAEGDEHDDDQEHED